MPQLNGLRALCVLVVIFHHWTYHFAHFVFPFEAGAFFFFVLSGFLITRILLHAKAESPNLPFTYRNFLIRRSLRIFPGYLLILGIGLLLNQADIRDNLLWYLSGFVNINFAWHGWQGGADQFWTLAIEQQFYLLWPLLFLFLPRKIALPLLISAFLLPTLARLLPTFIGENILTTTLRPSHFLGHELEMSGKLTWNCFDYLSAGCLYAFAKREKWNFIPKKVAYAIGLTATLLYLIVRMNILRDYQPTELRALQQLLLIIGTVWVIDLACHGIPGLIGKILDHPILQSIGTKSYGLYLYHNLVGGLFYAVFIQRDTPRGWLPLVFLIAAAILWLLASLSWKYLEKPLYDQKFKFPYTRKNKTSEAT